MNKFIIAFLACMIGTLGIAKAQTTVVAEELNSDEVQVTWGADWSLIEDFETGDFLKFEWDNNNSDYPWEICTDNPYEGNYCMKAGNHNILNSESSIEITLDIPHDGYITFYERISADNGFDCGRFMIDDSLVGLYTAVSDWIKREYAVTQGRHTFKWSYTKEADGNWNDDCFWVDYINFCKEPDPIGSTWLTYATPAYFGNVGSEEGEVTWAYRWPERELGPYAGYTLTKVAMYSDEENWSGGEYTVSIHRGATEFTPGEMLTSQTVTVPVGLGEYVEYELDEPVYIDGSETLWMVWHNTDNDMPAPACSEIDYYLDGTWFLNYGEWISLFYGAWMMQGYVLSPEGKEVKLGHTSKANRTDISYFNVYRKTDGGEAELLAEQITDTTYIDTDWATLEEGWYQWGVSKVYEAKNRRIETPIHWVGGEPCKLRETVRETEILWSNSLQKEHLTGLHEYEHVTIVYPNPANDNIYLSEEMAYVSVYDTKGVLVLSLRNVSEVNTSMLPNGLYLLKLSDQKGGTFTKEIVVKH